MDSNERNRIQRILALLTLGLTDALNDELISTDEAERLLFSPRMMSYCKELAALPELVNAIHAGTELDAVKRLLRSDQWATSIEAIRRNARALIAKTEPSDPEMEPWLPG